MRQNRNYSGYLFLDWRFPLHHGVPQKHLAQFKEWSKLNMNIEMVVVTPFQFKSEWEKLGINAFCYRGAFGRMFQRRKAFRHISRNSKDFLYRRYSILTPWELLSIKRIPTVIELNTNNEFFYSVRSSLLFQLNKICSRSIFKHMLGAVAVTEEISRIYAPKTKKPIIVITNPLSLTPQTKSVIKKESPKFQCVFLASASYDWNGVHLLETLIDGIPNVAITLVGLNPRENSKFQFHDPIPEEELVDYLKKFDFGIASFDLGRVGLTEAAPLKVRSYLSSGLPVIGRFPDSGISLDNDYYFQVKLSPNQTQIENKPELISFLHENAGRTVMKQEVEHLLVSNIENIRIRTISDWLDKLNCCAS